MKSVVTMNSTSNLTLLLVIVDCIDSDSVALFDQETVLLVICNCAAWNGAVLVESLVVRYDSEFEVAVVLAAVTVPGAV